MLAFFNDLDFSGLIYYIFSPFSQQKKKKLTDTVYCCGDYYRSSRALVTYFTFGDVC